MNKCLSIILLCLFSNFAYGLDISFTPPSPQQLFDRSYEKAISYHYGVGGERIDFDKAEELYLHNLHATYNPNPIKKMFNLGLLYLEYKNCQSYLKSGYLFEAAISKVEDLERGTFHREIIISSLYEAETEGGITPRYEDEIYVPRLLDENSSNYLDISYNKIYECLMNDEYKVLPD